VGEISPTASKLIKITQECLQTGIEQVKPGNRFGNIGYYIHKHATQHDFSVVTTFVGHGVGLGFHEEPNVRHQAPKDSGDFMKSGYIFTIEPMINEKSPDAVVCEQDKWTARTTDGGLSAQFEHTVLVTSDGYEILTLI